jgi:hypothetical protein
LAIARGEKLYRRNQLHFQTQKEDVMNGMPATLSYLLITWGTITAVLLALVIYGNTLSIREDDEIYLNRAEDHMMAAEQRVLITKMDRLKRVIMVLASVSGILLIASAGLWAWIGFHS